MNPVENWKLPLNISVEKLFTNGGQSLTPSKIIQI